MQKSCVTNFSRQQLLHRTGYRARALPLYNSYYTPILLSSNFLGCVGSQNYVRLDGIKGRREPIFRDSSRAEPEFCWLGSSQLDSRAKTRELKILNHPKGTLFIEKKTHNFFFFFSSRTPHSNPYFGTTLKDSIFCRKTDSRAEFTSSNFLARVELESSSARLDWQIYESSSRADP